MKLRLAIRLWILFLVFSSVITFAQIAGKWKSDVNSCGCRVLLTLVNKSDGTMSGTMNFPGSKRSIRVTHLGTINIKFEVDQPNNGTSITYEYAATVNGDSMTGTWAIKAETPIQPNVFNAQRQTDD